ncbi:uncharacterized protein LOC130713677 [Lotus japonicus]|uniref:uncharacterized protein LOC130713677 n=1 Tax=Lotus japonicus TaxID=34305 RepID=UPI00258C8599|nr:uncharacterized protein LOC130713677 [Lotus japonicus]
MGLGVTAVGDGGVVSKLVDLECRDAQEAGLGSSSKRQIIKELVAKEQLDMLLIQETKLEEVSLRVGSQNCVRGQGFLGLIGTWGDMPEPSVVVNVYSSCRIEEKRNLWRELADWKRSCGVQLWCIGGDFNAVRSEGEQRGITSEGGSQRREIIEFNNFVEAMELVDLPLAGRKYTWYRANGQAQSRIDRFLISHEWLLQWPNCEQVGLARDISYHCPLLLRSVFQDWGLKPFRVLNCWLEHPGFSGLVEKTLAENQVVGWGAFVLKEKLKRLKLKLKDWNKEVFGDLRTRRNGVVQKINELDQKEEVMGLSIEEIDARRILVSEFWSVLKHQESLLYQKSRSKWLKDGDQNTSEEIKVAVWDCGGDKSPGPDGFNFKFIQKFWVLMKDDFYRVLNEFWSRGVWPKGSNASFIALIPKVSSPLGLNDFRPISLIGCMYKVVSKILALRQKKLKKETLIFKVDYEKAYDSVSWEFLEYMMGRMHFSRKWIQWIMSCLRSASVSVLVNGSPCEEFSMKRGLRQEDPLAPFLFLIVAEGLTSFFAQAVRLGIFMGFAFGGDSEIGVSMLQFSDDTVFIRDATVQNVQTIKCVLRCFELISGLKVNFHKSKLAGVAVDRHSLGQVAAILHCKIMSTPFVYLGIPVGGRLKSLALWDSVIKKMKMRLSSWKQKHISFGGRVCLIQSILSALPLFFLSFFKVPVGVLTICTGIMRRFLWGGVEGDNKIN